MPPGSRSSGLTRRQSEYDDRHAPVRREQRGVGCEERVVELLARLLDHAADQRDQRHGGDGSAGQAERAQDQRAAGQAGVLQAHREGGLRHQLVLFGGGFVVPVLDDLFLGHQPLGPEHQADAHEDHHDGEQAAERGGVEAEVLRGARQVPAVRQRDERDDEPDAGQGRDGERAGLRRARHASRRSCRGWGTDRADARCARRRPRRRRASPLPASSPEFVLARPFGRRAHGRPRSPDPITGSSLRSTGSRWSGRRRRRPRSRSPRTPGRCGRCRYRPDRFEAFIVWM